MNERVIVSVQPSHPERTASLGEVSLFAERNRIAVSPNEMNFACVDEGYPRQETAYGYIRGAGEDAGMLMAVAGAMQRKGLLPHFTAGTLIDRYLAAKSIYTDGAVRFNYHTDTHKEEEYARSADRAQTHQAEAIGCGHVGQAVGGNAAYDVAPAFIHEMFADLERRQTTQPDTVKKTVLNRHHDAIGILFIDEQPDGSIPDWTVHSRGLNGDNYFVVDLGRTKHFLRKVVPALRIPGLEVQDVIDMYTQQAMETLYHVIPHGKDSLPAYAVTFENGNDYPYVKLLATISRRK